VAAGSVQFGKTTDESSGRVVALKTLRTDIYSLDTMKVGSEVELLAVLPLALHRTS